MSTRNVTPRVSRWFKLLMLSVFLVASTGCSCTGLRCYPCQDSFDQLATAPLGTVAWGRADLCLNYEAGAPADDVTLVVIVNGERIWARPGPSAAGILRETISLEEHLIDGRNEVVLEVPVGIEGGNEFLASRILAADVDADPNGQKMELIVPHAVLEISGARRMQREVHTLHWRSDAPLTPADARFVDRLGRVIPAESFVHPSSWSDRTLESPEATSWDVVYRDVLNATGRGFDDPTLGAARRAVVDRALAYLAYMLDELVVATVDLEFEESLNDPTSPTLASAGALYPVNHGFANGAVFVKVTTGTDLLPSVPDALVRVNFGHAYHTGEGPPPADEVDFESVLVHEIGHALGVATLMNAAGESLLSGSTTGVFTGWDRELETGNQEPLFGSAPTFIGSASWLVGTNGGLRFTGPRATTSHGASPAVHAPAMFQMGESLSHFEASVGAGVVLQPSIAPGVVRRRFSDVEIATFRDLGYSRARGIQSPDLPLGLPSTWALPRRPFSLELAELDDDPGADAVTLVLGNGAFLIPSGDRAVRHEFFQTENVSLTNMGSGSLGPADREAVVLTSNTGRQLQTLADFIPPDSGGNSNRPVAKAFGAVSLHLADRRERQEALAQGDVRVADLNGDAMADVLTRNLVTPYPRSAVLGWMNDGWGGPNGSHRLRTWFDASAAIHGITRVWDVAGQPPTEIRGPTVLLSHPRLANPDQVIEVRPGVGDGTEHFDLPTGFTQPYAFASNNLGVVAVAVRDDGPTSIVLARRAAGNTYERMRTIAVPGSVGGIWFSASEVYWTDPEQHVVWRYDLRNSLRTLVAGTPNTSGWQDGPNQTARFDSPGALVAGTDPRLGPPEELFVLDRGNRVVRRIDVTGQSTDTLAGTPGVGGNAAGPPGVGRFQLASAFVGQLRLASAPGALYLIDQSAASAGFRLRTIDRHSGVISTPAPIGVPLRAPQGLWTDGTRSYFFDNTTRHVVEWDANPSTRVVPFRPRATAVGDVNGDGHPDIFTVGDVFSVRSYSVSLGSGDGTFGAGAPIALPNRLLTGVELADVDADGDLDAIIIAATGHVDVYLGTGTGGFVRSDVRSFLGAPSIHEHEFEDLDGDGRSDLALVDNLGATVRVFLAAEDGRFDTGVGTYGESVAIDIAVGSAPDMEWDDLDGDRDLDLAVIGGSVVGVRVYPNNR